ncbi:MAG: imelysin family protein [Bacteroidota bacterium]
MSLSKISLRLFILVLTGSVLLTACKEKEKDKPGDTFDKAGILTNLSDNLIMPAYADLKKAVDSLVVANNNFSTDLTFQSFVELQTKFKSAYSAYQWCSTSEFGPAESEIIRASFNTFPCDEGQIINNYTTGTYDLGSASNIDAKGFPAIDYLLHKSGSDNSKNFSMLSNSSPSISYLTALIAELKTKTDIVNTTWSNGYRATFSNNTGTDAGGSVGLLVNQLNYDFELLKNAKIGIPLGKRTLGTPMPEKIEGYYSETSLQLITEQIKSIENMYLGRSKSGIDGKGLDDYLDHINAQYNSGSLNTAIKNKFISVKTKLAAIPESLANSVVNNQAIVDAAYAEMQQLVVLLKVDMPSALGVLITYQDNDGD